MRGVIDIRYASIREMDISNGEGVGVALFVQGCHFHCYNCFNPETWDFDEGAEWTDEIQDKFIELASKPYIKRITILGGEPLADKNLVGVSCLVDKIRSIFGDSKEIWIYSGYTWEQIMSPVTTRDYNAQRDESLDMRKDIILKSNILVDGRFIDAKKDVTLHWCGSSNQRVIDVKKSLRAGEIVLWN